MSIYQLQNTHFFPSILFNVKPDISNNIKCNPFINKSLHTKLNTIKNYIDKINDQWDIYKKFTNPYEFIHTIIPNYRFSICKYKPLSRSYYKMIEIMKITNLIHELPSICKTYHLAEGPGGFIEAIQYLRNNSNDRYYGMTLINDNDKNIPGWKKSKQFLNKHKNVIIEKGYNSKGDITNYLNYLYTYINHVNTCDLITGDGGFDYSNNFNEQEIISSKLIFCEIAFAIILQKQGGHFILKMFDIFSSFSVDCLYLLSMLYKEVYIVKPNTSRIANSEKYIVCKHFNVNKNVQENLFSYFYHTMIKFKNNDNESIFRIFNSNIPQIFIDSLQEMNIMFVKQQIDNIVQTLSLIDYCISTNNKNNIPIEENDRIEKLKKTNIRKCIQWCQMYGLPYINYNMNNNIFLQKHKNDILPLIQTTIPSSI